jgi:adenine-specific DNA-methyltransferase
MSIEQTFFSAKRKQAGMSLGEAAEFLEIPIDYAAKLEAGEMSLTVRQTQAMQGIYWKQPGLDLPLGPFPQSESFRLLPKAITADRARKSALGQFFTPKAIADFMAGLFSEPEGDIFLLDAGAGTGALTTAFVEKWSNHNSTGNIRVRAYESDAHTIPLLQAALDKLTGGNVSDFETNSRDFIEEATELVCLGKQQLFTHAILNPPYKKISSTSNYRARLSKAGLETVNLYSAFLGMAIALTKSGGEVVAIVPRSFCNGPYYLPFRKFMLGRAAISNIHVFNSRKKAFSSDKVLQENIVIKLTVGVSQGDIIVSSSTDQEFRDYSEITRPYSDVVKTGDEDLFIHISTEDQSVGSELLKFKNSLVDLGIECATGPVVDFRLKDHLRQEICSSSVPLLYPSHFTGGKFEWPKPNGKKANAIDLVKETLKWMMPRGHYTVVKRFSAKEEKRRIYASVVDPDILPSNWIGFENHLNVFHARKKPISAELAWGLAAYLNSGFVDQHFRNFNGHTQVNATDLRKLPYPDLESLVVLGEWFRNSENASDEIIDSRLAELPS